MDRLLRAALNRLICAGNASGHNRPRYEFSHSATAPARRSRSASPRVRRSAASCSTPRSSSAKPIWTAALVVERRLDRRCPCDHLAPAPRRQAAVWARPQWLHPLPVPPPAAVQSAPARARNVAHHYDLDGQLYALFLDADRQYSCAYFETPGPVARRRPTRQEAPSRGQAPDRAGPARARHRLRLGRACALSRRAERRARHRHHAVGGAARGRAARARRRADLADAVEFRLQDYRDVPEHSTASSRSACSSTSASGYYDTFFRKCAELLDRRRRDAAAFDRALGRAERHQSLDRQIYLPGRLHPGAVGGSAGGRARGPAGHRHRDPAPALCRDAEALARALPRPSRGGREALRRSASCGCGNSISRPPRWRSASRP